LIAKMLSLYLSITIPIIIILLYLLYRNLYSTIHTTILHARPLLALSDDALHHPKVVNIPQHKSDNIADYYWAASYMTPCLQPSLYSYLSLDMIERIIKKNATVIQIPICQSGAGASVSSAVCALCEPDTMLLSSFNTLELTEVWTTIVTAFKFSNARILFVELVINTNVLSVLKHIAATIKSSTQFTAALYTPLSHANTAGRSQKQPISLFNADESKTLLSINTLRNHIVLFTFSKEVLQTCSQLAELVFSGADAKIVRPHDILSNASEQEYKIAQSIMTQKNLGRRGNSGSSSGSATTATEFKLKKATAIEPQITFVMPDYQDFINGETDGLVYDFTDAFSAGFNIAYLPWQVAAQEIDTYISFFNSSSVGGISHGYKMKPNGLLLPNHSANQQQHDKTAAMNHSENEQQQRQYPKLEPISNITEYYNHIVSFKNRNSGAGATTAPLYLSIKPTNNTASQQLELKVRNSSSSGGDAALFLITAGPTQGTIYLHDIAHTTSVLTQASFGSQSLIMSALVEVNAVKRQTWYLTSAVTTTADDDDTFDRYISAHNSNNSSGKVRIQLYTGEFICKSAGTTGALQLNYDGTNAIEFAITKMRAELALTLMIPNTREMIKVGGATQNKDRILGVSAADAVGTQFIVERADNANSDKLEVITRLFNIPIKLRWKSDNYVTYDDAGMLKISSSSGIAADDSVASRVELVELADNLLGIINSDSGERLHILEYVRRNTAENSVGDSSSVQYKRHDKFAYVSKYIAQN
jgi:hypothetical protein